MTNEREDMPSIFPEIISEYNKANLNTCVIGQVEDFDRETYQATITPCQKIKLYDSDELIEVAPFKNCPVHMLSSGDRHLVVDIKAGSYGIVLFSQKAIATWLSKGGVVDPALPRRFSTSDALFIPGLYPEPEVPSAAAEADTIALRNGANTSNVKIDSAGDVVMNNGTGTAVEFARMKTVIDGLVSMLNGFRNAFNAHTHPAPGSPSPPITNVPTIVTLPTIGVPVLYGTGQVFAADMTPAESDTVKIP